MISYTPAEIVRFWSNVDRSGGPEACWLWTGHQIGRNAKIGRGYGGFTVTRNRKQVHAYAHRVAWELVYGPIPQGQFVCHHCDNPPCINYVAHFFLGTAADNSADMVLKGRGGGQHVTVINAQTLRTLRILRGYSRAQLAHHAGLAGQMSVYHLETGNHQARPATAERLALALSVSVAELQAPPPYNVPAALVCNTSQLISIRKAAGLSQTKLARLAGLNPATVNLIEHGKRNAGQAALTRLANVLHVSLDTLLLERIA